VQAELTSEATLNFDSARNLIFSPRWQGLSVVFDSRSGDFWVVSSVVRDVLYAAIADSERPAEGLRKLPPSAVVALTTQDIIQASTTS
jgi:hypothetical protein